MKKNSLLTQIIFIFMIGLTLTAGLSYVILKQIADKNVLREKELLSAGITADVERSLTEYRAYEWVLNYLIMHHADDLDLEYESSQKTEIKERGFLSRHNGLTLTGVSASQLETFSPEDQKTYAEIVFNHWLLRMNSLKQAYDTRYLYFIAYDDRYENGMFLITASDGTQERGTGPDNAFTLGTTVPMSPEQAETFRNLTTVTDDFVYTDQMADRYRYLFRIGDMNVSAGMTIEVASLRKDVQNQLLLNIPYYVFLQLLLSIYCLLHINFFALRPLRKVRLNVKEYAESKDSAKIREQLATIRSRNEIGDLAAGISEMTREIDDYLEEIRSITSEKERISTELNVAKQIQADMLPNIFPPFPEIPQFDIYATMDPAKEVGGDFYDFFMLDETHVALVMADVSGKGVPAALFMVISKTMIKNRALLGGTPSQILRDVNNQLCVSNTSELFVTVWMAVIDIQTGKGIAANAGHEHPALCRRNGSFELVKYPHSPALAVMEGMNFKEHDFALYPGDRIFVYTDGVPEATDKNDELYGTDRMLVSLNQHPDADNRELLESLKKDIDLFVGDAMQFDDLTMLVFDFNGSDQAFISASVFSAEDHIDDPVDCQDQTD